LSRNRKLIIRAKSLIFNDLARVIFQLFTFYLNTCCIRTTSINAVLNTRRRLLNNCIDFSLSPNPTTGTFNFTLSDEAVQAGASVRVYNIQGSDVYNSKITSTSTAVDISHLSKGFYLVKVADKTHFTVKKLVLN
jgi:hypothetical protein